MARDGWGASDCEALHDGVIAQPVATVSSLAFVAAAAWLAARLPEQPEARRQALGYAVLVAAIGLGSVAYHGPQPPGGEVAHDLPILLAAAWGVVVPVGRRLRGRPALAPGGARAARVAGAALAVGAVSYALGRTGSPLCSPDSLLQPHAAWHVAAAVAAGAWGAALWRS
jgi:hypothetical protein